MKRIETRYVPVVIEALKDLQEGTDECFINQYKLFEQLHAWHFDTKNLIGRKSAIDVNTLEFI